MPKVNGRHYPYTKSGLKQAMEAKRKSGEKKYVKDKMKSKA